MKNQIKKVLIIFLAIPLQFLIKLNGVISKAYTKVLIKKFKCVGEAVCIHYRINLIGQEYISLGTGVGIGRNVILTAWDKYRHDFFKPEINIGENVWIGEGCHITAIKKIDVGDDVLFGKYVTVSDNSHGDTTSEMLKIAPALRPMKSKGAVTIKRGVWLGDKATVLAGVTIGENSIIAANSVVNKDVPANCVVAGIPARVVKSVSSVE